MQLLSAQKALFSIISIFNSVTYIGPTPTDFDIAYGCFLFCGVTGLFISVLSFIPMSNAVAGGLGFMVAIPLAMLSLVGMIIGIVFAIQLKNHWQLLVLSFLSVLLIVLVISEVGSVLLYNIAPLLYGIIACTYSLAWFLNLRKQWGKAPEK